MINEEKIPTIEESISNELVTQDILADQEMLARQIIKLDTKIKLAESEIIDLQNKNHNLSIRIYAVSIIVCMLIITLAIKAIKGVL
jgi:hypothetical protein